jgi:hypothetical protein
VSAARSTFPYILRASKIEKPSPCSLDDAVAIAQKTVGLEPNVTNAVQPVTRTDSRIVQISSPERILHSAAVVTDTTKELFWCKQDGRIAFVVCAHSAPSSSEHWIVLSFAHHSSDAIRVVGQVHDTLGCDENLERYMKWCHVLHAKILSSTAVLRKSWKGDTSSRRR